MNWSNLWDPLQTLWASTVTYLPRILGVIGLLILAWIVARILRHVARKLVRASGVDKRLGKGANEKDKRQWPVAEGTGTVVAWIVWILFIVAILQVLELQAVLQPVTVLLEKTFAAIPNIIAALIVLVVFFVVGRFVAGLVSRLLASVGFDEAPVKMGLTHKSLKGPSSPSNLAGYILMVALMLFAVIMAADLLGFTMISELVTDFIEFFALVVWGGIIIGGGVFIANLVAHTLKTGGRSQTTISVVRLVIIVLSVAIGLRAMGFANDMILLLFGLLWGAVSLAAALAFGLGGRKVAGELLERWTRSHVPGVEKKKEE